jgi:DHA1 family bicyclomycin/chloramphenicol resistance-like MFS transporter
VFVVIGIAGAGALVVSWFTVPQAPGLPAARADVPSWVANLLELLRTKSAVLSILLMACTAGVVIGYLSGVSYLLQERFGMSATHYGVLFALNASTIFVAGQVNARLVRRFSPVSLLVGAFVLLVIAAGTLTVALATDAGLVLVESTLVLVLLGYGFAMANVLSTGMAVPRRLAATMASLLGVAQFGFGALTAPLAASATGAQIPSMALVLCGYTVAGLLLAVALRSARCPPQRKA